MRLYTDYCKEMYGRDVIAYEHGFIVYKLYTDNSLYIHAIYVDEDKRGTDYYRRLEYSALKETQPDSVYCYVDLTTVNPDQSLRAIMKAGYKIWKSTPESIMLLKELKNKGELLENFDNFMELTNR